MDNYRQLLYAYERVQEIKHAIRNGLIELTSNSNLLYIELRLKELISNLLRSNNSHSKEEVQEILKVVGMITIRTKTKKHRQITLESLTKNRLFSFDQDR